MMHDTDNDIAVLEQLMGRSRKEYRALQHRTELRETSEFPDKPSRFRPVALAALGIMAVAVLIIGLFEDESQLGLQPFNASRLVVKRPQAMPLSLRPKGTLVGRLAFERPRSLRKGLGLHLPRRPTGYNGYNG